MIKQHGLLFNDVRLTIDKEFEILPNRKKKHYRKRWQRIR